jgi:hypothetical protein
MGKKSKLTLKDLKVQSFITILDDEEKGKLKGASELTLDTEMCCETNFLGYCYTINCATNPYFCGTNPPRGGCTSYYCS